MISWLEHHENLAGWAQFLGAIIALALTYFTAFAPHWKRKRQLNEASQRLMLHGYETLESFHRTSEYFLPSAINIKAAILSIKSIINEIDKFLIYELDDHGSLSTARRLVATSVVLGGTCLFLEDLMTDLHQNQMSEDDREMMRKWIEDQLSGIKAIIQGAPRARPLPSDFISGRFGDPQ
ncbi:hypothetical protein [uncultured Novosphingobium sp.]|uniref:hypothetical protein n=1 Tax=uncultured Novosphingobium sp. TaxID=292277 RepID=UPI00374A964C